MVGIRRNEINNTVTKEYVEWWFFQHPTKEKRIILFYCFIVIFFYLSIDLVKILFSKNARHFLPSCLLNSLLSITITRHRILHDTQINTTQINNHEENSFSPGASTNPITIQNEEETFENFLTRFFPLPSAASSLGMPLYR